MELDGLVSLRRTIHAHPELAFLEVRTAALVLDSLRHTPWSVLAGGEAMDPRAVAGYPDEAARFAAARAAVESGTDPDVADWLAGNGTALVAELGGSRPGPLWAFRFDMDALPVVESADPDHLPARDGFRATNGRMHACAHDAHVAIGIGLAHRLADRRFPGRVRLLFQPGEEGVRGASAMAAAGAVAGVDRLVAVHLGNDLPSGVVVGSGVGMLATTKLRARFTGAAAHAAAAPQRGRNALAAAATAALGILAVPPFPGADSRVNVGTLRAGEASNIVPSRATLTCEVRASDDEVNRELERRVRTTALGAAGMYEVAVEIERLAAVPTLRPDDAIVDAVVRVATARAGADRVRRYHPIHASDDASVLARLVQDGQGLAGYALVGGGNAAPHHSARFDIAEPAMLVALNLLDDLVRTA